MEYRAINLPGMLVVEKELGGHGGYVGGLVSGTYDTYIHST